MKDIIKDLQTTLTNKRFIVGCSTGPDSMCLVDLIIKAGLKDQMIISFINHGIRKEAYDEEEYIKSYCEKNNIKLDIYHCVVNNKNVEDDARKKRYEHFFKLYQEEHVDYLVLGHNADDNFESIIMRLMKGSSLKGYSGILKFSTQKEYNIYRPLIDKSKELIERYNIENNIKYYIDKTNYSDDYLRNKIRHNITPLLKELNPNWIDAINYYSSSLNGANSLLFTQIRKFEEESVKLLDNDIYIKINDIKVLDEYLATQIIFDVLKPYGLSTANINNIYKMITSDKTKIVSPINDKLNFIKEYDYVVFTNKDLSFKETNCFIDKAGIYTFNDITLDISKTISYLDKNNVSMCYNDIEMPFTVRSVKAGDEILRKSKEKDYYQKVNNILTIKKVPYLKRINQLVIEKDNKIVCVLGLKIK